MLLSRQVTFVNAQGLPEAGLDHGGLMKELLEQVLAAGTQPEYGLFATTEDTGLLYPNPTAEAIPQGLALLEFMGEFLGKRPAMCARCGLAGHRPPLLCSWWMLWHWVWAAADCWEGVARPACGLYVCAAGMMVGKALMEGILLNLSFAPFFIRCLQVSVWQSVCWAGSSAIDLWLSVQGGRPGLDDVSSLDATLHSNLLAVKACPPEQVEHLCLTFAAEQQLLGKVSTDQLGGHALLCDRSSSPTGCVSGTHTHQACVCICLLCVCRLCSMTSCPMVAP